MGEGEEGVVRKEGSPFSLRVYPGLRYVFLPPEGVPTLPSLPSGRGPNPTPTKVNLLKILFFNLLSYIKGDVFIQEHYGAWVDVGGLGSVEEGVGR